MILDQLFQLADICRSADFLQFDGAHVALAGEFTVWIPDIGNAPAHTGAEVAAGLAKYHYTTAGHVFAAVITDAFNNCTGATVSYRKSLGRDATEIGFPASCSIKVDVTGDDVFFG